MKTIRLNGEYWLNANGDVMEYIYDGDDENYNPIYIEHITKYSVGAIGLLKSREKNGCEQYYMAMDELNGAPGNMNHKIKRFHGWRGTSNNVAIYAHGLRRINKIRKLNNGQIAITVGNDLSKNHD